MLTDPNVVGTTTFQDKLIQLMNLLRINGIDARMGNWTCCITCGRSELIQEYKDWQEAWFGLPDMAAEFLVYAPINHAYIFSHMQDDTSTSPVYFAYGWVNDAPDFDRVIDEVWPARRLVELAKTVDLTTKWDGTLDKKVGVFDAC